MIFQWINPSEVVASVFDEYNIKSTDFIQRTPNWIFKVLQELKINKNYEPHIISGIFSSYKFFIGDFVKKIDEIYINDTLARYNNEFLIEQDTIDSNRRLHITGDIDSNLPIDIDDKSTMEVTDKQVSAYYYYIENQFIHTNIECGRIKMYTHSAKVVLDDITGLCFPLIPDEVHTKNAIQAFILKTIIMRGYVHPLLSLRESNPFINPALKYKNELDLARVAVNSMNKAERKEARKPLIGLFGKDPKLILSKEDTPKFHKVSDDNNGKNSTKLMGGYAVGNVFENPIYFEILSDSPIGCEIIPRDEFGYLFIAVPINRKYTIYNELSLNITDQFINVDSTTIPGATDVNIFRIMNKFYLGIGFEFTITFEE